MAVGCSAVSKESVHSDKVLELEVGLVEHCKCPFALSLVTNFQYHKGTGTSSTTRVLEIRVCMPTRTLLHSHIPRYVPGMNLGKYLVLLRRILSFEFRL